MMTTDTPEYENIKKISEMRRMQLEIVRNPDGASNAWDAAYETLVKEYHEEV